MIRRICVVATSSRPVPYVRGDDPHFEEEQKTAEPVPHEWGDDPT